MNFYISDLHWGQDSAVLDDDRPYENITACYQNMKERWNQKVHEQDHVYIIGDCMGKNVPEPERYLEGLNGHLHLIVGNHDSESIKRPGMRAVFESIDKILNITDVMGNIIVMCHFPMICWEYRNYANCYHIYGHVHKLGLDEHGCMTRYGNALNAGCMINNYEPCTLEELIVNNEKFAANA